MVNSSHSNILRLVEPTAAERFQDSAIAAMVGSAVADAMGWITEFIRSKEALERHTGSPWLSGYVSWPKNTGGRFNTYIDQIDEGEYSDDTQLSLCVARSIEPDGTSNANYFMKVELPLWMQYARGAGSTITAAAKAASRRSATPHSNFFSYRQGSHNLNYREAGANGAAMRVLPLAIANVHDSNALHDEIWMNAIITHGHPRAIVGALLIGEAARRVLNQEQLNGANFFPELERFVRNIHVPESDHLRQWQEEWDTGSSIQFTSVLAETKEEVLSGIALAATARDTSVEAIVRQLGCFERNTKGSGIATTIAALALFFRYGGNFRGCVEHAVNLIGADTDTIAAMSAGLAGAIGGTDSLPEEWTVKVQDYNYLNRVAQALTRIALKEAPGWELGPQSRSTPDGVDLSKATSFSRGQRIAHPIFGMGWVAHVQTQAIRRKAGGTITLVDVEFDMGQKIRLRTRPQLFAADRNQIQAARSRMLRLESIQPGLSDARSSPD
jgi:ADP-ribosylglycohydrolase